MPTVDQARLNVLVTGVGGRSVGCQILHALTLLGDRHRVICTDADAFSFGLYQGPHRYIVPTAAAADYLDAIRTLVQREKIDVILPGTEPEVRALATAAAQASDGLGCHLVASPVPVIDLCQDKAELYRWLAAEGIGVPRSAGIGDWQPMAAAVGFPLVAKPAGASGGSRNVAILSNEAEVARYIREFPGPESEIVFQEYVGDAESEYTVGVVIGRDGKAIDSIVMHRKLVGLSLGSSRVIDGRRYDLSTGYSQGFIVRDPEIQEFCESLAVRMDLIGPANFQLRRHRGAIKVFEVHPRFSGTSSIRADAGFNEPDMVIRDQVLGERVTRQPYRADVAAIRAFTSVLVPIADMAQTPRLGGSKA
jgi:carbamoyl-phosphate synthase large subunit